MTRSFPDNDLRRSQLYRWHQDRGAIFADIQGASVVKSYSNAGDETTQVDQTAQVSKLALLDLSLLPRVGVKGTGAPAWLGTVMTNLPQMPNQSTVQSDGTVIARLSNEEFLVIDNRRFQAVNIAQIQQRYLANESTGTYLLPRGDSHCLFLLTGRFAADTLAKLCAVDLGADKFSSTSIAQTSVARVNAIVMRHDIGPTLGFYVLCDSSSSEYLWTCLIDAMQEFSGVPVGLSAFDSAARQ